MKLTAFAALLLSLVTMSFAESPAPIHVALIFDDGPVAESATRLADLLAREQVHVTFGAVGQKVQADPATAKRLLAAGHELANHSWSHLAPDEKIDDATLAHEIGGAQKAITEVTGVAPKWYWPPFLAVNERVKAQVAHAGITLYTPRSLVVSKDYDMSVGADEIRQRATTGVTDGCVILFHEWRAETAEQLPAILAELKRQGCVFLTFSQLAAYNAGR
ncbi:MAG TPA: polysaccharide deacetylase family protein [Opitutaceae bacterium]|nr:polysaccharide deacetylase family protein [Opitutaceae bacterium]HQL21754.1 polysaccharide deacetylase family protein [Opitutaceae bacterium]